MKKILILVIFLILCSCASFRKGTILSYYPKPIADKKYTLSVSYESKCILNESEVPCTDFSTDIISTLNASGLFSEVKRNLQNADFNVDVQYKVVSNMSFLMSILTGLTLYVWPSWATDKIYIETTITNNKNKKTSKFALDDSLVLVQEVLLLPLLPFKCPLLELNKLKEDALNALPAHIYESIEKTLH